MDRKEFPCGLCNTHFRHKSSLIRHMCQHTGQRPHPCTACRKAFLTPVRLRRHWARRHNNPLDSGKPLGSGKPLQRGNPLENDNGKPLEKNDNGKPLENDNGKPLENDNGKPLENDYGKPLENVNSLDNDMPLEIVNLLENDDTLANDKPPEADNQLDDGTPIDDEIRLDYDNVSQPGVTTSLSILECEIIGIVEAAGVCFSLPCYNQGEAVVF